MRTEMEKKVVEETRELAYVSMINAQRRAIDEEVALSKKLIAGHQREMVEANDSYDQMRLQLCYFAEWLVEKASKTAYRSEKGKFIRAVHHRLMKALAPNDAEAEAYKLVYDDSAGE